jgi:hypothetical protein
VIVGKRFHPATKATKGNAKALKHGAYSEKLLAPLREQYSDELAADYPQMDTRSRTVLASRLAKWELAEHFLNERGLVKNDDGDVFAIADRSEKWGRRIEDILRAAGVQRTAASPVDIALAVAALTGSDGGDD